MLPVCFFTVCGGRGGGSQEVTHSSDVERRGRWKEIAKDPRGKKAGVGVKSLRVSVQGGGAGGGGESRSYSGPD